MAGVEEMGFEEEIGEDEDGVGLYYSAEQGDFEAVGEDMFQDFRFESGQEGSAASQTQQDGKGLKLFKTREMVGKTRPDSVYKEIEMR